MTTTTATLRMLLLICISLGQVRLVSMQSVKVPANGVYLITMVADPDGRGDMFLQLNGRDAGFVAYGVGDAVAGLTVAVYLKTGTTVSARYTGNTQATSSLGVAFASYDTNNFLTVRCSGQSSGPPYAVDFSNQYTLHGVWRYNRVNSDAYYMRISTTGIYWVAARPDCGNGAVSLDVGTGLFNVFCDNDKAVSASGAFYLRDGSFLKVTYKSGRNLEGGTSFSFVYLQGNEKKYIKNTDHLAYTAWANSVGNYPWFDKLIFNKRPLVTNYGSLFNYVTRTWTIPTSGSYIVSMRGDPDRNTLKVILYKNNKQELFAFYNEKRTKSGQAGVFQFKAGDTLYLTRNYWSYLGKESFMSIALLWVA